MEDRKINKAIEYYEEVQAEILEFLNRTTALNTHIVINKGEELADIRAKISALKIAKNN